VPVNKVGIAAAAIAASAGLALGGAALANAATTPSPSPSSSSSSGSGDERTDKGRGGTHTPVTGDELAKVTAAVKVKDSAVTVTSVRKDEDGSYDVFGTKAGADVRLDVSADLKTFTEGAGRGGGGHGGGGSNDTPVTGDELAKVTAAMKAKDSAVTVTSVRKDPDGSYDVLGTKAGANVMFDVSADLKTFTENAGRGGGGHGGGRGPAPSSTATASPSSTT
jgi:hypothetical protein